MILGISDLYTTFASVNQIRTLSMSLTEPRFCQSNVWLITILKPRTWYGGIKAYTLVTKRVKFLRHWSEIRWYFRFSPLKLSSLNWTVSPAGDVTSSSLAALFALLSIAECFKIYTIHTIRLLWCLQPIHFCSTDILKEKYTPASVLS